MLGLTAAKPPVASETEGFRMPRVRLDPNLLAKMASRTGKEEQYLREQISRKATRSEVSSLAAQMLWAKELGLAITSALNRADPVVREEVRTAGAPARPPLVRKMKSSSQRKSHPVTGATIDFLLQDSEPPGALPGPIAGEETLRPSGARGNNCAG